MTNAFFHFHFSNVHISVTNEFENFVSMSLTSMLREFCLKCLLVFLVFILLKKTDYICLSNIHFIKKIYAIRRCK